MHNNYGCNPNQITRYRYLRTIRTKCYIEFNLLTAAELIETGARDRRKSRKNKQNDAANE